MSHASLQELEPVHIHGLITPVDGADGGVNHNMIHGHERGLLVILKAWLNMQAGDWVEVFWGNDTLPVAADSVLPEQAGKDFSIFIAASVIPEGIHGLSAKVTRAGGNEETTPTLAILVRTVFPGGTDPDPQEPNHQNLLPAEPELPPTGIIDEEAAKNGIKVTIPGYPNMRVRDRITFSWGGELLAREVTQADMDADSVQLLVPEAVILAAGDSDELALVYRVRDEVHNPSSHWSMHTSVIVEVGKDRLPAPLIENPDPNADPYDVIDLDDLGDDELKVSVLVVEGSALMVGDLVAPKWVGTTAQGLPVAFSPAPQTVPRIPVVMTFLIPNASVRDLGGGSAVASYAVNRDGSPFGVSKRRYVSVIGVEQSLPKPRVEHAVEGALDPALEETTVIVPGEALEAGDNVYMTWLGTRANGSTLVHEDDFPVSGGTAGKPMRFSIAAEFIAPLDGGTVEVYYRLYKRSIGTELESARERLTVGDAVADLPPPFTRPPAVDGVLDPESLTGALEIVVPPWPGMNDKQTVHLLWRANNGPDHTDYMPVSAPMLGKEVPFHMPRAQVESYLGGDIELSYRVEVPGKPSQVSAIARVHIGPVQQALPPPIIPEAEGDQLDPDDVPDGATVHIDASARLRDHDQVTVRVISAMEGGSVVISEPVRPGEGGKPFSVTLAHAVIAANIGSTFDLEYEIDRAAGGATEHSDTVTYAVRRDIEAAALRIMGARFCASTHRASKTSRRLLALREETLAPLTVEWRYDGEQYWTASSQWIDEKPWLKLYVRSGSEIWLCHPTGIFGNGIQANNLGYSAFIAMRDEVDGETGPEVDMVGWGHKDLGGEPAADLIALKNVAEVSAAGRSFVARLRDGTAVYWGTDESGSTLSTLPDDFVQIRSNAHAYVGRRSDNSLFSWGSDLHGVPVPDRVLLHRDYIELYGAGGAFAALRKTGNAVAWGSPENGGEMRPGQALLDDIVHVMGNAGGFVALRDDKGARSVIAWGNDLQGGLVPDDIARLTNVSTLAAATNIAFAILLQSGEVKAWPPNAYGGSVPGDIAALTNLVDVVASAHAFCALQDTGQVHAWGLESSGGKLTEEVARRSDIVQVTSSNRAFAALCRDGSVVAWGDPLAGGDTTPVLDRLVDVRAIHGNGTAFTALTADGHVVTWGSDWGGGDSSKVQHLLDGKVTHSRMLSPDEARSLTGEQS